jgi:hypothetical protein
MESLCLLRQGIENICLHFRRIKEANLKQPWIQETNFRRQSYRKDRNILKLNKKERELFHDYTTDGGASLRKVKALRDTYSHPILDLMVRSGEVNSGVIIRAHPILKMFFRTCRKVISPAINIAPRVIWADLESYLSGLIDIHSMVGCLL